MLVKNVTLQTSAKNIWLYTLLFFMFCVLSLCITAEYINFNDPVNIPLQVFKGTSEIIANTSSIQDKFLIILVIYIVPLLILYGIIYSIISRNNAIKDEASVLSLVSVEFKPRRVGFNFNRQNCNFSCTYKDINSLIIEINVTRERTKNGYVNVVNYISLHFTVLNNKRFTLTNTTMNFKGFIYKIIDYTREVENLVFKYSGDGNSADIAEVVDCYRQKGMKPILTKPQESSLKIMSIVFFIIGLFFIFSFFSDMTNSKSIDELFSNLFVPIVTIGISLIFDAVMIIDKVHEKKYEKVTTWKRNHSKDELKI